MNVSVSLPDRIDRLLQERQQHAEAILTIDKTLEQINALLGAAPAGGVPAWTTAAASPSAGGSRHRQRRPGAPATTGEQSILGFVGEKGSPTTREINAHFKAEGRRSTADGLLGMLVKSGLLKRRPLGGKLGSEYSLTGAGAAGVASPSAGPGRPRKRGSYSATAEETVLQFVREKKNPTTREIKEYWDSEGRRGKADNELSRLVQDKKLKRTPLVGERGSRYSIP